MCFYLDEYCEVWRQTTRKARKPHRCYECGGTIQPGETYEYVSYIFDHSPGSYHLCNKCENVREHIKHIEEGRGCHGSEAICPVGGLRDAIWEDHDHYGLMADEDDEPVNDLAAHLFTARTPK